MRASALIFLAALALSLVVGEVVVRLFFPVSFRAPPRPLPHDLWRELLHRRSSLPGLSYELAPDMHARSHGTVIRTNSHGMREREIPIQKPDSVGGSPCWATPTRSGSASPGAEPTRGCSRHCSTRARRATGASRF